MMSSRMPPSDRAAVLQPWRREAFRLPIWLVPLGYAATAIVAAFVVPRLEHAFFSGLSGTVAPDAAIAFLSTTAGGMMALTAIVFSIAYITVQFNAIAYSPRLALWFARDPMMFHALGIFIATFVYALGTVAWVERGGTLHVPVISMVLVIVLLLASMLVFVLLVRGLTGLTITNTLHLLGDRGRDVIRKTFERLDARETDGLDPPYPIGLGPATQMLKYSGEPRSIAELDRDALVAMAQAAEGVIALVCAVGDTLVEGTLVLRVHAKSPVPMTDVMRAIKLSPERTFEQDPKYPIRLLVDIAIKALSPAINDPTTAVQAIDQVEDLLRRLGGRALDAGYARDARGVVRLIFPMPTWEDYLRLSFDEIRQYGMGSVQVMRRLRAALAGIAESVADEARTAAVQRYLLHLDMGIERSPLDTEDRVIASQADRQGLGMSRAPEPQLAADTGQPVAPALSEQSDQRI
jgi:uncharacterized membrane protein